MRKLFLILAILSFGCCLENKALAAPKQYFNNHGRHYNNLGGYYAAPPAPSRRYYRPRPRPYYYYSPSTPLTPYVLIYPMPYPRNWPY